MKFLTLIAVALGLSTVALAQPSLYNSCSQVKITPVPNGAGVFLSEDCKIAYVLPPLKGALTVTGMTVNESLRLCPAVQSSLNIMADQAKRLEKLSKQIDENGSAADLLQEIKEVNALYAEINLIMKDYWKTEGSTGQAIYSAQHQELVKAYQKRNPKVTFVAMPLAKAQLHFTRRVTDRTAAMPATLAFHVPGLEIPGNEEQGNILFGGVASGQLVLSLIGACPFYDVQHQKMKVTRIEGKTLAPYFNGGVSYEYNLKVNKSYSASYHLANFMRRVQSSESSGGFFSTSTISKLIIEKESNDWFQFTLFSEDPRHEFEDSLRATVKADLIDRAFKQIALLTVGPAEAAPDLIQPKANGAQAGAAALSKCPHLYCQVGAALLEVGNAIFGSTQAVSEFIQRNDFWAKEDVLESKMLPFMGTSVFVEGNPG